MQQDAVDLAPDTLDLLKRVSTATITTQLVKNHGMRTRSVTGVRPVDPARCRFVGPAYTVRYVPMREDLILGGKRPLKENPIQEACDTVPAGSVVVIDQNGDASCGSLGDILMARLIVRGVVGVVSDGGMRDIDPVRQMTMPVFCRGHGAPPSFASLLVAEAQGVIGCGGVLVIPGDIVVGDADGVVVIPRYLADQVARDGDEQERTEAWIRRKVESGARVSEVYPLNERYAAEYRAWVAAGRPEDAP
jgi:regulator of RNase E activity RraA